MQCKNCASKELAYIPTREKRTFWHKNKNRPRHLDRLTLHPRDVRAALRIAAKFTRRPFGGDFCFEFCILVI